MHALRTHLNDYTEHTNTAELSQGPMTRSRPPQIFLAALAKALGFNWEPKVFTVASACGLWPKSAALLESLDHDA